MSKEVLKRTTELLDLAFRELFDDREITEEIRDDHVEGDYLEGDTDY